MNVFGLRRYAFAVLTLASAHGQTLIIVNTASVSRAATIQMGILVIDEAIHPPQSPLIFAPGTHLQFIAPATGYSNPVARWSRGQTVLPVTSTTLDIASATESDSGDYSVTVSSGDGPSVHVEARDVQVAIAADATRLPNLSTRMHVDATHPATAGFVVNPATGPAFLLVRAVGPSLARFGVSDSLPVPTLEVVDASGLVRTPFARRNQVPSGPVLPGYPTVENTSPRVGAFALDAGSADFAALYLLSPGAYTARVRSGDGAAGEVLLEAYHAPF